VGITHDEGENEASLGLTYERKFDRFGTGFILRVHQSRGSRHRTGFWRQFRLEILTLSKVSQTSGLIAG
jgi:hypothetical protein